MTRSWFEWIVASNLGGAFRPPASITRRETEIMPFKMLSRILLKKPLRMTGWMPSKILFKIPVKIRLKNAFEDPFEEAFEEAFEDVPDNACDDDRGDDRGDDFDGDPRKLVSQAQAIETCENLETSSITFTMRKFTFTMRKLLNSSMFPRFG
jgi:hypothetical protein